MPADCICKYLRGSQAPTQPMNQINAAGMEAVISPSIACVRTKIKSRSSPVNIPY